MNYFAVELLINYKVLAILHKSNLDFFCPKSGVIMKTHEKIRQLRELSKITQEEFADKLAISPSGYFKD